MTYSGVTNIFDSLEGGTYDFESLRISDPNLIFCVPAWPRKSKATPGSRTSRPCETAR